MGGGNTMKKWYKAKIRNNISDCYNAIPEIMRYAGKHIYVSYDAENTSSCWGKFLGRVDNRKSLHFWNENCFSEIIEI
jgi:hypothetical protein